jgi:hypothetical protein
MAIHFPKPPSDVAAAAAHDVPDGERETLDLRRHDELGGAPPLMAQPIFTAGLRALAASEGDVEQVTEAPSSWRYASELGGAPRAFEFVTEVGAESEHAARVGDDQFTPAIRQALAAAQDDPRVRADDFEARLLRVPALKLLAVWLHAAGAEDLFAPVAPTAVEAAPGELYSADDFRGRLREAASRVLSQYESAERPDELGG